MLSEEWYTNCEKDKDAFDRMFINKVMDGVCRMKVLVAESHIQQLEELNIEMDLKSMQSLVGGFIELTTHPALQGYIIVSIQRRWDET